MKYLLAIVLYLLTHMVLAADSKGNYAIWGLGQKSCFSYSNTRNTDDDRFYRNYLMGYLTAYNTQTPETYRISGGKNLTEILSWLDDYCESKPVHGFDQAVYEFIDEHYPKRVKRATGRGRR